MKKSKTDLINFSNRLNTTCNYFDDHDFKISREFGENIMKLHCTKCQKLYGANIEKNTFFDWEDKSEITADFFLQLGA